MVGKENRLGQDVDRLDGWGLKRMAWGKEDGYGRWDGWR